MELEVAALAARDRYKLLIGGVLPRPIAFVSTLSADGVPNLAPFSFFNAVGSRPMLLQFCPANRADGSPKDSLANALPPAQGGLGEFVVNVVPHALGRRMAATAEELPPQVDEFAFAGIQPEPSARVRPPRVAASPLAFECVTRQVLRFAEGVPGGANLVLGEVLHVRVHDHFIDAQMHLDAAGLDLIGRLGGRSYASTRDRFELPYGRAALEESP